MISAFDAATYWCLLSIKSPQQQSLLLCLLVYLEPFNTFIFGTYSVPFNIFSTY